MPIRHKCKQLFIDPRLYDRMSLIHVANNRLNSTTVMSGIEYFAKALALGTVENFSVPSHLNGFQLSFVRLRWVVFKVRKRDHIFVQVGETDRERIKLRMGFREQNPDVFGIAPSQFFGHE